MACHRPAPTAVPGRADPLGLARFGFIVLPAAVRHGAIAPMGPAAPTAAPAVFPALPTPSPRHPGPASPRACMCRPSPIALLRAHRASAAPGTGMRRHAGRQTPLHSPRHPALRPCGACRRRRSCPSYSPCARRAARRGRTAIPPGEERSNCDEQYRRKEGLGVPAAQPRLQGGGGGRAARGDGAGAVPDAGADRGGPGGVGVGPSRVGGPAGG